MRTCMRMCMHVYMHVHMRMYYMPVYMCMHMYVCMCNMCRAPLTARRGSGPCQRCRFQKPVPQPPQAVLYSPVLC